jgi:hypothetical protein
MLPFERVYTPPLLHTVILSPALPGKKNIDERCLDYQARMEYRIYKKPKVSHGKFFYYSGWDTIEDRVGIPTQKNDK